MIAARARYLPLAALALHCVCGVVCCRPAETQGPAVTEDKHRGPVEQLQPAASPPVVPPTAAVVSAPVQLDMDGDDDVPPQDSVSHALLAAGHFERVGRAPAALQRICDLTPLGDALYAAHATRPLGLDGASVTRYRPSDARPFSLSFDWNRAGEPTKGGGAGQGFLRVHAIAGRLFVADADPPYNGFGISEPGTEGFVFVSSPEGKFASARQPGHLPPRPPDALGKPGAAVLPRAYHVIDVIRFRGFWYAATGSVPPGQRAWHGASPAALQVERELGARFDYVADYPRPYQAGVWRFTFLVRFRDRLYAGLQDYDGQEPNDYVYFDPPHERSVIAQEDLHAVRVTRTGAAQTLRWYAARGKLYWIAWSREGVALRVTSDGESWQIVALPGDVGVPTDVLSFRGAVHVLTSRALLRLTDDTAPTVLARITDKRSPFELDDSFCAAPLAVFRDTLYAGSQRDGALYRFVEGS
ncbi:MAG: hypothetical protein ABW061_09620 [Polyangiaceae bacterium]